MRTPCLPAEGVGGHLVYGGKGTFEDLNGRPVDGGIVLMDFGCGQNYLNAMTLGARAIVFFDDGNVTRGEAEDKFLEVPVNVPRFWIAKANLISRPKPSRNWLPAIQKPVFPAQSSPRLG